MIADGDTAENFSSSGTTTAMTTSGTVNNSGVVPMEDSSEIIASLKNDIKELKAKLKNVSGGP